MEELKNILNEIVKDYGLKILEDSQKFKAVFADYARGEYIAEKDLFSKIIEISAAKEINDSEDILITKKVLIKKIHNKYFLDKEVLDKYLDLYIRFFRIDYTVKSETNELQEKKPATNKRTTKKPSTKLIPQINENNKNIKTILSTIIIICILGILFTFIIIPYFKDAIIKNDKNMKTNEYFIWGRQNKHYGGALTIHNWPYKNNIKLAIWVREHKPDDNKTQSEESKKEAIKKIRDVISNGEIPEIIVRSYATVAQFKDMFGVSPFYLVDSDGNDWYGNGNFDIYIRGYNNYDNISFIIKNVTFSNGSATIDYYNLEHNE